MPVRQILLLNVLVFITVIGLSLLWELHLEALAIHHHDNPTEVLEDILAPLFYVVVALIAPNYFLFRFGRGLAADAERRLQDSERAIAAILNNAHESIYLLDPDGAVRLSNAVGARQFGRNAEGLKTLNFIELLPQPARDDFRQAFDGTVRNHDSRLLEVHSGGSWRENSLAPVLGEDGRVRQVLVVCRDVTQRRSALATLEHETHTQQAIADIAHMALEDIPLDEFLARALDRVLNSEVFGGSMKGTLFLADPTHHTLTLKAHKNLDCQLQNRCAELKFGECLCGRAAQSGAPLFQAHVGEGHDIRPDGMEDHGHYILPILKDRAVLGVLNLYVPGGHPQNDAEMVALRAIADTIASAIHTKQAEQELDRHRRHLEELVDERTREAQEKTLRLEAALAREKQQGELQRQFVSLVSHEFRTPLTIIDGAAQRMIRRGAKATPDEVATRAGKVRGAVKRMTNLIETTLYASRLDEGKIAMHRGDVALETLIRDIAKRQAEISPDHTIALAFDDFPATIPGDEGLLDQVFTNLLGNAVKYSPNSPKIEVKGWRDGGDVLVSVSDHGLGIPNKDLPFLFKRYFRAATAQGIPGTGIGLNVCREFIHMHGGRITLESAEGQGSRFTVRLPARDGTGAPNSPVAPAP
ncbi:MAG: GAF domain-containing protein [Alphaproteobacteria bacterium]|nr:GAF domain-containing protein [Alphaproteobacteria bacterium]